VKREAEEETKMVDFDFQHGTCVCHVQSNDRLFRSWGIADLPPVPGRALTLPTEGGGRYAAAQIYDWTITNSRKPEMAINYFFARMGLFGAAVVNYRRDGASLRARRTRKFSAAPKPAICQSRVRPTTRSM
jgi:hypothetical protein